LNPRPGSTLLGEGSEKVTPDLLAIIKNKKVRLELNRGVIPQLTVYNPYKNTTEIAENGEARRFLKENMVAGKHLIDNLKRREATLCRVADYILKTQRDAVLEGSHKTKKLTITDIAEALNLHPSTICRTVSNKYIQLDNTTMPLKSFLSHGVMKENGEITSKTSIKVKIGRFIEKEDRTRPLSDSSIVEMLTRENIFLKRRTIAKYRESMRILPAHLRRKKN